MSPRAAALLRFLVEALAGGRLTVLGEPADVVAALAGAAATRKVELRADESGLPAAAGLVWVAPGALPEAPTAGRLYLASDADAFAAWPDACVAWLPLDRGREAEGLALAMDGKPPAAILDVLASLHVRSERQHPTEPISDEVGRLLFLLARARAARRVLDAGSSSGASLLWLGAAMRHVGGRVSGVEQDSSRQTLARRHVRRAGLETLVEIRLGELKRLTPALPGPLDMVFLDEALEGRAERFEALLARIGPAALVLSHGGQDDAAAAARYHATIQLHPQVRRVQRLPLGGELSLALVDGGWAPEPPAWQVEEARAKARQRGAEARGRGARGKARKPGSSPRRGRT